MSAALEEARLARCNTSWPIKRVRHIARLIGGGTPSKGEASFWSAGTIPWVSPKDMKARVITETEDYITEEAVDGSATSFVDEGSPLMVVRSGILRHTLPVALAGRRLTLNQDMKAFRLSRGVDSAFLVWWFEGQSEDLLLEWRQFGATVESIDTRFMMNGRIALPDLNTQKAIAAYLDRETARIDQLIAKKERQASVLTEREEATFLGVVTAQSTAGPRKNSGVEWIGSIPAHWSVPKFTHVARQETGHTPSRKEESYWVPDECVIPWFSLADVWQIRDGGQIFVHETAEKISELGIENSAARLLPADTVILSRTASVGFPAILSVPMATTQDFAGWICGPRVRPKFLYYVLRSMKPVFRRLMMGSTHQTIYMPDIRAFRLPLPPLNEQDTIVQQLDQITGAFRSAARRITESVERLREYRAALITAAVTGQLDIREKMPAVMTKPERAKFRVIVGAEIIHRHQGNPKFGRVKLQKELYLAEIHAGINELNGNYLREAAGPLDRALIDETERALEAEGFYRKHQPEGTGTLVTYAPLSKAGRHADDLKALLGPRADTLRSLIDILRDLDKETVEAVATLYAVWNDALIEGRQPDDATIINGVLTEWHAEKGEKFTHDDLARWIGWMKRQNLIPRGQGPKTTTGRLFV